MNCKIIYLKDKSNNKLLPFQYYNLFNFVTIPVINKVPFIKKWNLLTKTVSPSNITHNISVISGETSCISVLDIDDHLDLFENMFGKINTPTVITGKGIHLYFKYDKDIKNSIKLNYNGNKISWDFRNSNTLVTLPPSKINEITYKWVKGKSLNDISIKKIPIKLKKFIIQHQSS